jgi:hypothetical protein
MSNDPLTELEELEGQLLASRSLAAHWRAQARTWEDNAGQAVALANREQRKRHEAYAKLDILAAEFRALSFTLADAMRWITGTNEGADTIEAVTDRFLASLQRQTAKLEAGDSRDGNAGKTAAEAAVEPGLADRGAGSHQRQHD